MSCCIAFLGCASGVGGKSVCNAAAVVLCHNAVRWKSCATALHFLLYICSLWWIPLSALSCCTTMHRCNVEKLHWFLQSCFLSCGKSIFHAAVLCCAARHTYIKMLYCFFFWIMVHPCGKSASIERLLMFHAACRWYVEKQHCFFLLWFAFLCHIRIHSTIAAVLCCTAMHRRYVEKLHHIFQPFLSRGGKSTPTAPLQIFCAALQSIGVMPESSVASFSMCCAAPLCIGVRRKSCVASLCHGSRLVGNPPQCIGVTWKSSIAFWIMICSVADAAELHHWCPVLHYNA